MDINFLNRCQKHCFIITLIFSILIMTRFHWQTAIDFVFISFLSQLNIFLWSKLLSMYIKKIHNYVFFIYIFLKIPFLYIIAYLYFNYINFNIWTFLIGFNTIFVVILLKLTGVILTQKKLRESFLIK